MKVNLEKAQKVIDQKFPEGLSNCTLCRSGKWGFAANIFELREFQGGDLVIGAGGTLVPLITLTCENCGNVQLLNALKLGLVDQNGKLV